MRCFENVHSSGHHEDASGMFTLENQVKENTRSAADIQREDNTEIETHVVAVGFPLLMIAPQHQSEKTPNLTRWEIQMAMMFHAENVESFIG